MAKNDLTNSHESESHQETGEELHIVVHISDPNSWEVLDGLIQDLEEACYLYDKIGGDENGNLLLIPSHDK